MVEAEEHGVEKQQMEKKTVDCQSMLFNEIQGSLIMIEEKLDIAIVVCNKNIEVFETKIKAIEARSATEKAQLEKQQEKSLRTVEKDAQDQQHKLELDAVEAKAAADKKLDASKHEQELLKQQYQPLNKLKSFCQMREIIESFEEQFMNTDLNRTDRWIDFVAKNTNRSYNILNQMSSPNQNLLSDKKASHKIAKLYSDLSSGIHRTTATMDAPVWEISQSAVGYYDTLLLEEMGRDLQRITRRV